jgi:chromosome segregation ATPase
MTDYKEKITALDEKRTVKQAEAQTANDQISVLREQLLRIKEDYDVLTGEIKALTELQNN